MRLLKSSYCFRGNREETTSEEKEHKEGLNLNGEIWDDLEEDEGEKL